MREDLDETNKKTQDIKIDGVATINSNVSLYKFTDMFIEWIESIDGYFCGSVEIYNEDEEEDY